MSSLIARLPMVWSLRPCRALPMGACAGITLLTQSRPMRKLSRSRPRRSPPKPPPAADFWRFSLSLYGLSGVAEACLDLQDRRGLDVNLLLFCCWRARSGIGLEAADLALADRRLRSWRGRVIQPL